MRLVTPNKDYPREELIQILHTYNKELGNDSLALENVQRLDKGFCVITGQQLGFCGGPTYTILKAISCILLAKRLDAIPVFWAATEDHDIEEIRKAVFVDEKGNLKKFRLAFENSDLFVEDLVLTQKDHEEITTLFTWLDLPLPKNWLQKSYAKTMVSFLIHIFRGTGLVFLEPHLLRPLARDFFQEELSRGGKNLFYKTEDGQRKKIPEATERFFDMAKNEPERLSTNVYARPVLQSKLLPTVAYIAGPSEMEYLIPLKEYFSSHQVAMPKLISRISATFIPPHIAEYLEEMKIKPWDPIPPSGNGIALHEIRNTLFPMQKPQERVLNWLGFKLSVQECLEKMRWEETGHYYGFL